MATPARSTANAMRVVHNTNMRGAMTVRGLMLESLRVVVHWRAKQGVDSEQGAVFAS